ncbi:hypothetical protein AB6N23_03835 [Cellulomonas sp. 179-A 9B4 NHS]|uniref:hypothetical protein n=1 Tax=Cellulomonas sp. 179-A 9B4 NHS TaxID=3142379 RepID=UPI0039A37521
MSGQGADTSRAATSTTRPPTATDVGLGLVVPADWWVLRLADADATRRTVAALVEERFGRDDALAALRRELRVSVSASARRAAAAGGWLMAFMLTRVADVPLPATLTAFRVPGSFATDGQVDALRASLTAHASQSGGQVDAADGPSGLVLRSVRERVGDVPGAGAVPVLLCDYWSDPGDDRGLVHLGFSTPLPDLRDGWLDLFDAVAATLHRLDEPTSVHDDDLDDDTHHDMHHDIEGAPA